MSEAEELSVRKIPVMVGGRVVKLPVCKCRSDVKGFLASHVLLDGNIEKIHYNSKKGCFVLSRVERGTRDRPARPRANAGPVRKAKGERRMRRRTE